MKKNDAIKESTESNTLEDEDSKGNDCNTTFECILLSVHFFSFLLLSIFIFVVRFNVRGDNST